MQPTRCIRLNYCIVLNCLYLFVSVNDSKDVSKYSAGFHACFQEVQRYLSNECTSGTSEVVKKQLVGHLGGYMQDSKTNSSSAPCITHPNIAAKAHGNDGPLHFVLPFENTGNAAEMPQPPTSPLGGATGVQMPVNFLYAMPATKQNPEIREGTGVQVHMSPRAPSESHVTQSAPNSNIAYVIPVNAIRTHEANGHVIPVYANVQQLQNFSMVVPQVHDVKPTMNNAVPFPLPVDNNNNNMVHHNNDNHQLIGPGLPVQNPKQEDTMWRPW